ncbi:MULTISPECIES: hypothetical protein [unclassified Streptomyces]|uniref:hypothetical protein n=1 Tax=unclassified Streptomyces TaxID=2593676 RepID=UPI003642B9A7
MQLLPPPGPWRSIVRAATQQDPQRRPQSVRDLLALIDREHVDYPEDHLQSASTLLEVANNGDPAAADALLNLVSDHPQDYELYVGVLTGLATEHAGPALARDFPQAQNCLRALVEHEGGTTHTWCSSERPQRS